MTEIPNILLFLDLSRKSANFEEILTAIPDWKMK